MAKIVLEVISDTGPLTELNRELQNVSATAKKAGEDEKKAFQGASDQVKQSTTEIKKNVDVYLDAANKRKLALDREIKGLELLKDAQKKAFEPSAIKNYNTLIKEQEEKIKLLGGALNTVSANSEKLGGATSKVKSFYGGLRTLANIIPGIGISGLILQGYEFLIGLFSKFTDSISVNTEAVKINKEAIDKLNESRTKLADDTEASIRKELEATGKLSSADVKRAAALDKFSNDQIEKEKQKRDTLLKIAEELGVKLIEKEGEVRDSRGNLIQAADRDLIADTKNSGLDQLAQISQFNKEKVKLEKAFDSQQKEAGKSLNAEISAINAESFAAQKKLDDEAAKKAAAQRDKDQKEKAAKAKKALEDELALRKRQAAEFEKLSKEELISTLKVDELEAAEKESALKFQFAQGKISQADLDDELRQLKLDTLNKQLADLEDYAGSVNNIDQQIADKKSDIAITSADNAIAQALREKEAKQQLADAEVALNQTKFDAILALSGIFEEAVKGNADAQAALFSFEKIISIAQIITQLQIEKAKNAAANAALGVAGLPITIAQNQAANIRAGIGIATIVAQAIPKLAGFAEGGYTGDGGKYEEAGPAHKGEFVHTQEKTRKHRNLFEVIHNNDYSNLRLSDITNLLSGTGVSLRSDVAENINIIHSQISDAKIKKENAVEAKLSSMQKDMNKFFSYHKGKPTENVLSDGTRVIKKGNVTRIIRPKK